MLEKFNLQSVNQLNAGVKLLEMWKALNVVDYPLIIKRQENSKEGMSTRADLVGQPIAVGKSALTQGSCVGDYIQLWNKAPKNITESTSLKQAKNEIKAYVKTLPI